MSHHIVTVCVVCVLCAAHVPCSAHTNSSSAITSSDNSTSTKNHSDPDTGGRSFWSPIRSKDIQPYSKSQQRYNPNNFTSNKYDAVRSHIMRHIDSNNNSVSVTANATSTASHIYHKKEMTESSTGDRSPQNTRSSNSRSADVSVNVSKDAELLERLAQTELPGVKQKSAQSSEDLHTVHRSRLKRDVNERYFMQKIFEAYGDGTSITMEGFEKLVRKLGLLRLLTDVSKVDGDDTDRSMYKNKSYNNRRYTLKEDEVIDKANFLHVIDNRNFPSKGLYDTDNKNNKERVR